MPNFRLTAHNLHDDATLSETGTSVANFGPTNTQNTKRGRVLRVTGADYVLKGTLAGTCSASSFQLFRHTLPPTATVQLELFSDAAWSSSVYDSTALSADCFTDIGSFDFGLGAAFVRENVPFVHAFPVTAFQSYTITLDDAGSPDICRAFLGLAHTFSHNPLWGVPLSFQDLTDTDRTIGGSQSTNNGANYAKWRLDFKWLSDIEFQILTDLFARNGTGKDMAFSLFPEDGTMREAAYTRNVKFTSLGPVSNQITGYEVTLDVQEQ